MNLNLFNISYASYYPNHKSDSTIILFVKYKIAFKEVKKHSQINILRQPCITMAAMKIAAETTETTKSDQTTKT